MKQLPPEAEKHLQMIKDKFCELVDKKYRKGYDHHRQLVWKADVKKEIQDEAIDILVYILTLRNIN